MAWPEPFPDLQADEATTLCQRLDHWRAGIVAKLLDLTDAEATSKPLPRTDLSVGGIVHHLGFVEDRWFTYRLAGRDLPPPWSERHRLDPDASMDVDGLTAAAIVGRYEQACDRSREVVSSLGSLDSLAPQPSFGLAPVSLRWVLTHLIGETACHAGHIDLLRDAVGRGPRHGPSS